MVTYQPDLYDAVTPASFQGDLEWYRCKALESGGPVLELGAGTGRVTLAIAEAGPTIYALASDRVRTYGGLCRHVKFSPPPMANGTTTALPMRLVWGARRAELQFGRASNQSFATYSSIECDRMRGQAGPGDRTHPEPTYPNGGGLRRRPRAY